MKNKKANKMAKRRLANASKALKEGNDTAFYEEALHACWGYLSDKLTIPLSALNRDNIKNELSLHGVEANYIKEFEEMVEELELARYAPNSTRKSKEEVLDLITQTLIRFEKNLK